MAIGHHFSYLLIITLTQYLCINKYIGVITNIVRYPPSFLLTNYPISNSTLSYLKKMSNTLLPSPPFSYLSSQHEFLDLTKLDNIITEHEVSRQEAFALGAKIKAALLHSRSSLEQSISKEDRLTIQNRLEELVQEALVKDKEQNLNKTSRLANLSYILGDYVRYKAYVCFLETGGLVKQSSLSDLLTDDEYLSGIITFNRDLARYAIGRATERDVKSVQLARDLVARVLDYLMEYDFRNGNLRRKYGKFYAVCGINLQVSYVDVDVDVDALCTITSFIFFLYFRCL
jgi:Translin family.